MCTTLLILIVIMVVMIIIIITIIMIIITMPYRLCEEIQRGLDGQQLRRRERFDHGSTRRLRTSGVIPEPLRCAFSLILHAVAFRLHYLYVLGVSRSALARFGGWPRSGGTPGGESSATSVSG
jgi:hypothetical protein